MPVTVLLVGNSRLHWGRGEPGTFRVAQRWDGNRPPWPVPPGPWCWAHVGPLPEPWHRAADTWPRPICTAQIPLRNCPDAVGVDRALAAWTAFQHSGSGTMVVDAGTALTITAVDGGGHFCGGRIAPGVTLQLQSLHRHTAALPLVEPAAIGSCTPAPGPELSHDTRSAMVDGVVHCLCAGVATTVEALASTGVISSCWLTGGDAPLLRPVLEHALCHSQVPLRVDTNLALSGLLRLADADTTQAAHH